MLKASTRIDVTKTDRHKRVFGRPQRNQARLYRLPCPWIGRLDDAVEHDCVNKRSAIGLEQFMDGSERHLRDYARISLTNFLCRAAPALDKSAANLST